ncbi:MAG: molybdate ABC transporter substrate-binding protein [Planctomycetota bacterium]
MLRAVAWLAVFACLAVAGPVCQAPRATEEATVTILVAASAGPAVKAIAADYQTRRPGLRVRVSTGASNALAQQIVAGAPADLFLSASEAWADTVRTAARAEDAAPLLTNEIVLITPPANPAEVRSPADLLGDATRRVALAGEAVPAGVYAEQALRSPGLYESLVQKNRLVRGSDSRVALSYVERGEADAGVVYATDALASERVAVVHAFDPATHSPVVYPLVLVRRERSTRASRSFFDYLQSDAARRVFQKHGFGVDPPFAEASP